MGRSLTIGMTIIVVATPTGAQSLLLPSADRVVSAQVVAEPAFRAISDDAAHITARRDAPSIGSANPLSDFAAKLPLRELSERLTANRALRAVDAATGLALIAYGGRPHHRVSAAERNIPIVRHELTGRGPEGPPVRPSCSEQPLGHDHHASCRY